jgi:tetratricopeptide (TPR) repeat protein
VRLIPNFAEEFFRERIRQAPDVLENYVLLADCYSRNDKAVEAELILREALKRLPDCPLLLVNLSEAYARGEKYDEMNQALDRILEIDPAVPAALQHQLDRALKSENFDEAQGVLDRLEQLRPGSSLLYESRMKYYSARKQIDKIIETNAEAFSRHPDDWNVVYLATVIANQTTQKYDRAIEILKEFVKRHYTTGALFALADCYQRSSQMDRWEETFGRLFKHDPCTPGWHSKMAEVYFSLQQYANAERALKAALAICPNNSNYWSRLGNVYRSVKDPVSATTAYRAALTYAPTDFEARESLREIEGKRSSFARFRSFAIDSLVRSAPDARAYPNDKGIILLDDTRRVVFEGGTSVVAHETLAKIFTRAGIDDLKEFQIAYNANNQQLIVEKALSLKRDGSQVKADVEKGYVVFKSLEEGDCIYLKWKVKDYYSGRLSRHFWDTKRFNRFLPVRACRYALLVPQGYPFRHSTQNMPDAPTTASSEDGTLYEWMLNDQDAIAYEQGMPGINDVGRTLFLSTIPSWEYLVDWYADLAHTKTTSSFEIRERVAALMAEKSAASEEDRIRVIYEYITENIRYSFVSFRQSGFVPQKARDVLVNRLGDCKDMTTLFIAMLREVGLDAHYVLVNTIFEGENRNALPAIVFDHCIAAVETRAGLRYFDVTASDYPMGSAPLGDLGAFALRITPDTRSPVYLEKSLFSPGTIRRLSQVVARADNSVSVRRQSTRVGSAAGGKRSEYRSRGQEDRGKALTQLLAEEYPNMKLVELSIRNLDVPSDTLIDEYAFEIPGYVTESGPFRLMKIPWTDILPAVGALSYEKRVHQTNYWPDADTLTEEMRITLPPGYVPVAFKPRTQHTSPNATYTCTLQYAKGILSGRRQFVHVKTAVPPQDYQAFKAFYTSVMKEDGTQVLLRKK